MQDATSYMLLLSGKPASPLSNSSEKMSYFYGYKMKEETKSCIFIYRTESSKQEQNISKYKHDLDELKDIESLEKKVLQHDHYKKFPHNLRPSALGIFPAIFNCDTCKVIQDIRGVAVTVRPVTETHLPVVTLALQGEFFEAGPIFPWSCWHCKENFSLFKDILIKNTDFGLMRTWGYIVTRHRPPLALLPTCPVPLSSSNMFATQYPACQPPALLSISLILVLDFTATNPKISSRQPTQDLLKKCHGFAFHAQEEVLHAHDCTDVNCAFKNEQNIPQAAKSHTQKKGASTPLSVLLVHCKNAQPGGQDPLLQCVIERCRQKPDVQEELANCIAAATDQFAQGHRALHSPKDFDLKMRKSGTAQKLHNTEAKFSLRKELDSKMTIRHFDNITYKTFKRHHYQPRCKLLNWTLASEWWQQLLCQPVNSELLRGRPI
ncbi:hypothetical protein Anapl_08620 [Anas platyrhynchos]|uniref:Uncharacterized protein n=1 Tax=Anas platyrhynchos TaxID=8839 RepID=R0M5K8_ANAPL|nr:hypothetical protein Anapl_08620 [Anas platyrhynchos]